MLDEENDLINLFFIFHMFFIMIALNHAKKGMKIFCYFMKKITIIHKEQTSKLMSIGAVTCFIGLSISPIHLIINYIGREGWILGDILNILGIFLSFILYNFIEHKRVIFYYKNLKYNQFS